MLDITLCPYKILKLQQSLQLLFILIEMKLKHLIIIYYPTQLIQLFVI